MFRRSLACTLASLGICAWLAAPAVGAGPPGVAKWRMLHSKLRSARSPVPDVPGPIRFRDSQVEPVGGGAVDGWDKVDHAAAFATFVGSCRRIAHTAHPPGESRPMYPALHAVCQRALRAGTPGEDAAKKFFEDN